MNESESADLDQMFAGLTPIKGVADGPGQAVRFPGGIIGVRRRLKESAPQRVSLHFEKGSHVAVAWAGHLFRDGARSCRIDERRCLNPATEVARRFSRDPTGAWVREMDGEFAFVAVDWRRRRLLASRDALGCRPLHYCRTRKGLAVSSEPDQLLALPGVGRTPDPTTLVSFLSLSVECTGRSFFASIAVLPAGHSLRSQKEGLRIEQHYRPPSRQLPATGRREYSAQLRQIFETAVADRAVGFGSLVSHASGGLDSSSIFCVLDSLRRQGLAATVVGAAAVFGHDLAQEGRYLEALDARTKSKIQRWDGDTVRCDEDFTNPSLARPGGRGLMSNTGLGDVAIAKACGAGAVFSGLGGDQALAAIEYLADLAARARILSLVKGLRSLDSWELKHRVRGALSACLGLPHRRTLQAVPVWAGPVLAKEWARCRENTPTFVHDAEQAPSLGGRAVFDAMLCSSTSWTVDNTVRTYAEHGLEFHLPFFDRRLINYLVATRPVDSGIGWSTRSHFRTAMKPLVPSLVLWRKSKSTFEEPAVGRLRRSIPAIEESLHGGHLYAAGLVSTQGVLRAFKQAAADKGTGLMTWWSIAAAAAAESWLRETLRYNASMDPSRLKVTDCRDGVTHEERTPQGTYEPPSVSAIGNVKELVAGAGGSAPDTPFPGSQPG